MMMRQGWETGVGVGRAAEEQEEADRWAHTRGASPVPLFCRQTPPGDPAEGPYMRLSTPAASPSCNWTHEPG